MEVTSIVLAGGKNLRLGRNKALEIVGGKRLIDRVIQRVRLVGQVVLIVTSRPQSELPVTDEVKVVPDVFPGKGPLGGIYSGLLASSSSYSVAVACDMPFLNARLLRHMVNLAGGFDAVIPRLGEGRVEPLHAVYSRSCLDEMKTWLEQDRLEINRFLTTVHVRYIEADECREYDPQLLSFFNINSQSDLDYAIELAGQLKEEA